MSQSLGSVIGFDALCSPQRHVDWRWRPEPRQDLSLLHSHPLGDEPGILMWFASLEWGNNKGKQRSWGIPARKKIQCPKWAWGEHISVTWIVAFITSGERANHFFAYSLNLHITNLLVGMKWVKRQGCRWAKDKLAPESVPKCPQPPSPTGGGRQIHPSTAFSPPLHPQSHPLLPKALFEG